MLNAIFISNQARMLLRSLLIIGACTGLVLGTIGTSVPWFLPYAFTSDHAVVGEVVFHCPLLNFFSPFTKYQSHLVSYFQEKLYLVLLMVSSMMKNHIAILVLHCLPWSLHLVDYRILFLSKHLKLWKTAQPSTMHCPKMEPFSDWNGSGWNFRNGSPSGIASHTPHNT